MIRISVVRDRRGDIVGWSVSGHSGFAPRGEDIVCAGVSAIVQTTLLGLQNVLGLECAGRHRVGELTCSLPPLSVEERRQADLLLLTMLEGLTAIAEAYADYVTILDQEEV